MAFAIGEFIGGFIAVIFIPLFLFYFASKKGRSVRVAIALRSLAVLAAVFAVAAEAVGGGGQFPAGAVLAALVCFVWAVRASLRDRGRGLNGWQRLGVIASALWFVGGFVWGGVWVANDAQHFAQSNYQLCEAAAEQNERNYHQEALIAQERNVPLTSRDTFAEDDAKCLAGIASDMKIGTTDQGWTALMLAVFPLLLFWGLAWLCIRLHRWVRAGFARQDA